MNDNYNFEKLMDDVKVEAQKGVPSVAYDTWMSELSIYSIEENLVTLIVPSSFFADQLKSYELYLKNCFKEVTKRNFEITYI